MKLKQEIINKVIKKKDKSILTTFCIIKERQCNMITKTVHTVYSLVTEPKDTDSIDISKEEARSIIELYGLVPALKTNEGVIYDTPDQQYRQKYQGRKVRLS